MIGAVSAAEKAAIISHLTVQVANLDPVPTVRSSSTLSGMFPSVKVGPGDESTWGPCTGHPNDPRTVEEDDTIAGLRMLIEDVQTQLGRAERAIAAGDLDWAIDVLHSAGRDLAGACHE